MNFFKQEKVKQTYPFLLLFITFSIYHLLILPCYADDVNLFKNVLDNTTMKDFLFSRYSSWSSRILIEMVLVRMVQYPVLWKILDTLLIVLTAYMLSSLLDTNHKYSLAVCTSILLYPFIDMSNAGWISTTLNYMWPLAGIVYLSTLLQKTLQEIPIKIYEYMLCIPIALFTCNHEQAAAIILGLFIVIGIAEFIKNQKLHLYILLITIIDLISMIFILTCPGNAVRMKHAISCGEAPDFATYSSIKKLELGLFNIERIFVSNTNLFFLFFLIFLIFLLWKSKKNIKNMFVTLPIIFVMFGYQICNRIFPESSSFFVIPERSFKITEFSLQSLLKLVMLFIPLFYFYGPPIISVM